MLGQQFFSVDKYASYVNKNVIPFYADTDEDTGGDIYDRYEIGGGPSTAIVKNDGSLYDILTSYNNNPDQYLERVKASLSGENAYATLKAMVDRDPDDLEAKYALSLKHVNMWQSDKATAMSKEILKKADEAKQLEVEFEGQMVNLFEMATFGVANGEMYQKRSVDSMEKFRTDFPNTKLMPIVFTELANMYGRLRATDRGMSFFQEAVSMYPENAYILRGYVRYCLKAQKNYNEAQSHAERMVALRPNASSYRRAAAELYVRLAETEKAIAAFGEDFMHDYLNDTGMLNGYAWFWALQEANLESALKMIKKAAKLDPTDANLLDTMSMVYWKMKDYTKAVEIEEKALQIRPGYQDYIDRIQQIKEDAKKSG